MKITKATILILLTIISFSACEKDDICVDATTPLLIIRFYDFENPTALKSVPALRVVGVGRDTILNTFTDRSTLDSIGVPLNIEASNSIFRFTVNSANDTLNIETGNTDDITFSYKTIEKFKSRACGFTVTYENLGYALVADSNNWIKQIQIDTTVITNSTSAHVKIYH